MKPKKEVRKDAAADRGQEMTTTPSPQQSPLPPEWPLPPGATPATEASSQRVEPSEDGPVVPWESLDLGQGKIRISFQGMIYQLRVTRNGKLILTK